MKFKFKLIRNTLGALYLKTLYYLKNEGDVTHLGFKRHRP